MENELTAKLYACVIVRKDDRALVVVEKDNEGTEKYNLPGGGVELGESPYDAAIRECREEVGLDVSPDTFLQAVVNTWPKKHSLLLYFGARCGDDSVLTMEEGMAARWMTVAEVSAVPDASFVFGAKAALLKSFSGSSLPAETLLLRKGGELVDWGRA